MDGTQIDRTLRKRCRNYIGTYAIDMLPRLMKYNYPVIMVINLDDSSKGGSHWVALAIGLDGRSLYFDSFGRTPPKLILEYMKYYSRYQAYNDARLQSVISNVCGFYVIFFSLCMDRGLGLNYMLKRFTTFDTSLNDTLVHRHICNLLL